MHNSVIDYSFHGEKTSLHLKDKLSDCTPDRMKELAGYGLYLGELEQIRDLEARYRKSPEFKGQGK